MSTTTLVGRHVIHLSHTNVIHRQFPAPTGNAVVVSYRLIILHDRDIVYPVRIGGNRVFISMI